MRSGSTGSCLRRLGRRTAALACAALLSDRVTRTASVVSVAPYGAPGLDFAAGLHELSVTEFEIALRGP